MLAILVKLLKALNSEQSPGQLAAAISLAAILGLTPLLSLHNLLVILIALWFRVNLSLLILSYPMFAFFGYLLSSSFDTLGLMILHAEVMQGALESFYNTLIGRWSNFYYSGVMGSFVVSLILAIILYPVSQYLVEKYRKQWLIKFENFGIVRMLKVTKFWKLYSENQ